MNWSVNGLPRQLDLGVDKAIFMEFLIATFRLNGGDDGEIDMLIGLHKK